MQFISLHSCQVQNTVPTLMVSNSVKEKKSQTSSNVELRSVTYKWETFYEILWDLVWEYF